MHTSPWNNRVLLEDLEYIFNRTSPAQKEKLGGARVLVTGCAGFLGYYFLHFLLRYSSELGIEEVIGLDNFKVGRPEWLEKIASEKKLSLHTLDITAADFEFPGRSSECTHVLHMASIASPTFYRMYPIETLDANIWGLRRLLDFYREKKLQGMIFFSSSEVYGDPTPEFIPTPEEYRGNTSSIGPRACYDEAKRFGETLCYLYAEKHGLPVTLVRPFNNYGPGMRLDDRRVPADFMKAIISNEDILIHSDGSPTRTFCYIADAIDGYLKALTLGHFDYFNIGISGPEITVQQLADIYVEHGRRLCDYRGRVIFKPSGEKDYLTHNPARRCPSLKKAAAVLGYKPGISVEEGVGRFMEFTLIEEGRAA